MKTAFGALLFIFFLTVSTIGVAQTRRRGTTPRKAPPAAAKPQPEPVAQPTAPPPVATSRPPLGPVSVVELNGQTLSTADLDTAVRQQLDQVENKIDAAKREILDVQINTILFASRSKQAPHRHSPALRDRSNQTHSRSHCRPDQATARRASCAVGGHRSNDREPTSDGVSPGPIRVETCRRSRQPFAKDNSGCDGCRRQRLPI